MEPANIALQERVVNAFLDQFEDDPDWVIGFVHADFSDQSGDFGPVCKAFLVRREPDPERPDYVPLEWATIEALIALHKEYGSNDEAFGQLDLEVAAGDGRYRFRFYRDAARPSGGQDNSPGAEHLLRSYRAILART